MRTFTGQYGRISSSWIPTAACYVVVLPAERAIRPPMARVFFVYSHHDEMFRDEIDAHLAPLRHEGVIETWHDRKIGAGGHVDRTISGHLEEADIILLLVSSDFMASDYCIDVEMRRAVERQEAGEAVIIPVILRPCDWHRAAFGRLNAVPRDGRPVSAFTDRDAAFLEVARAVREVAMAASRTGCPPSRGGSSCERAQASVPEREDSVAPPRLRVRKDFTDHDRDHFLDEAFEYMVAYFDRSLQDVATQDADVKTRFRRSGDNAFTAAVYVKGTMKGECRVWREDGSIAFSWDANTHGGLNERLSVEANGHKVFLRSLGMASLGQDQVEMTKEESAEYYWNLLARRLQ